MREGSGEAEIREEWNKQQTGNKNDRRRQSCNVKGKKEQERQTRGREGWRKRGKRYRERRKEEGRGRQGGRDQQ